MAAYLTFFLLFLLAFVIYPAGISPFEFSKVILAEAIIICLILISVLSIKRYPSVSDVQTWLTKKTVSFRTRLPSSYLLLCLGLLCLFTYVLHPTSLSFFGNSFRGQGVFLYLLLLWFSSITQKNTLPKQSSWLILLFLIVQLLASIVIADKDGRAIGTIGEPNALAAYAASTWLFLFFRKNKQSIILPLIAFSLTLLLIIFSGSRSGLVALSLEIIFLLATRFISFTKAMVLIIVLFGATLLLPLLDTKTMYENRGEIWKTALIAGYEHPIIGYGFGNTEVAFKEYNKKLYNRLRGYYVDSSHNVFLDMWLQGGLLGLSLFLLLLIEKMREFIRTKNRFALLLLIGLITCMSFNPVSVVLLVQFWWLMGSEVDLGKTSTG